MVAMANTPKRHSRDDKFEKPAEVKSTTAPTPKPQKLKLHTKSPYGGGSRPRKADQRPFIIEEVDRGGGSPVGP
jgi:hypothetical protein